MIFFSSPPPGLRGLPYQEDYFQMFQQCTQKAMRGRSPLTVGERELIAAFVSGVNSCRHCHGAHVRAARAFGIDGHGMEPYFDQQPAARVEDGSSSEAHRYFPRNS